MDGSFRIGRLFGIPILIHYSFTLVIPLFAWIIGSQITFTVEMLQGYLPFPSTRRLSRRIYALDSGTVIALGPFFGFSFTNSPIHLLPEARGSRSTASP